MRSFIAAITLTASVLLVSARADDPPRDAVLLPTVSNKVRHNPAEIKDYFEHFLEAKPVGKINEQNIRRLRYDNVLAGELLLQSHGATICAHAHGSGGVKADQGVLGTVANRDGLNLKKRSINR